MTKKIKESLFAKIFLLALLLLFVCSVSTYALIAFLMPQTYSLNLSDRLDEKVKEFISTLETVSCNDSSAIFDSFLQNPDVSYIELLNSYGDAVDLPTQNQVQATAIVDIAADKNWMEAETMQSYDVLFKDSDTLYTLLIYGNSQPINQLRESFIEIIPVLFLITIMIAMFIAYIFSKIVTKPIVRTSKIAEKMSQLSFDGQCDDKRSDEIGMLQKSLNTLSVNLSGALRDLQDANYKLQKDIEKDKEMEKNRLEFFSAVSHELKTPITIIKGQMEGMLLGIGAYKDHKKYLSRSLEIANTLETMVHEILTVSRLETADTQFVYSNFDISQTIKEYLASIEDLITKKGLSLNTNIEAPAFVIGNKTLLTKVTGNLISNAVFYSPPENEINITAKIVGEDFTFSIENTGVHISNAEISKIFEAFYRADQSRNRQTGGSGLGLYLVQKILEQHKTRCSVRNTDKGVCFSFILSKNKESCKYT